MLRQLSAYLLVVVAAAPLAGATLKEARQFWLKGNYEEAQAAYEDVAKKAKTARDRAAAAVGLSRALQSQGEYDKALEVVEKALSSAPRDADLLARKAEVLYLRGRWDEAEKAADAAVARNREQFLARWVRAQVYRDRGELTKAEDECRWFVRTYTKRSNMDDDIKDAEELALVGLAGCEHARWHALPAQFRFILNEMYRDALKNEPNYWVVELQAGQLLMEKYNRGDALDAFDKALAINPSAAEVLAARGQLAFQKFEFKDAEKFAKRALAINPRLPEALRLQADVHLAGGEVGKALQGLEKALAVNPRDEHTLARLGACHLLMKKEDDFKKLEKEVRKHDSKPAVFYHELAERLEDRRRYDEAQKYYERAVGLRPKMTGPVNSLGLLHMRLGREKEARPLLDRGFKADKFNVRVSNMRRVLKHLDTYKDFETKHFRIRYDPKNDEVLVRYMAPFLEEIYADLARQFNYKATGPILIEVFNNHEMFSGRTVALPDLHTIGACTGKVITMVSPNGKGIRKPFNWARVMRHELVHIFNLEQTTYLVPHWLTEGLAVSNEGFPRPQIWNELLVKRVPEGNLLTLDTIDLGFIRPRNQLEWNMAYCQAHLYIDYARKKYGPEVVGKLLAAYAEGLSTSSALAKACNGVSKADFEKGYREHLQEVVRPLVGKQPPGKQRTLAELQADYKKNPDDLEVAAELALRLPKSQKAEARKLAQKALAKNKKHPKASVALARLERLAGNADEEKRLLENALDKKSPDTLVLRELAQVYYDGNEFAKAAEVLEMGRKAEPFNRDWLLQLARAYARTKQRDKQIAVLKDLVPTDADDFDRRERLARLLLEEERYAEAEKYAKQALEIDVRNADARETLFDALKAQKRDAEVARLQKIFRKKS